jgi:S1-C subfamily serine protease
MQKCLEFVHADSNVAGDQHRAQLFKTPNLGFKVSEITDEIAAKTGLHKGPGIVVFEVTPGSLAERSGLKVHDRIMAVAGCGPSVNSYAAMKKCVANKKAYIGMVVDRGGDLTTIGIRLCAEGR